MHILRLQHKHSTVALTSALALARLLKLHSQELSSQRLGLLCASKSSPSLDLTGSGHDPYRCTCWMHAQWPMPSSAASSCRVCTRDRGAGVKHADDGAHVLGSAGGAEARDAAADDEHLGRRDAARRCDLAPKQPAKLIRGLNHSPGAA